MKKRLAFTCFMFSILLPIQSVKATNYTNSIGMEFKNISAGTFYMGSCKHETNCLSGSVDSDALGNEAPQHLVHIKKSFQLSTHEVTLGQFKKFILDTGRDDLLSDAFIKQNMHGDDAAVTYVSWHDAQDFINWLNKKEGHHYHYRLPTEAEWEYAARAATTSVFSWGNNKEEAGSYAWYRKNAHDLGDAYAHRVGRKHPNPWGLYDMHGNVWEWVQDWYGEYQPNKSTPISGKYRVLRGGSWFHHPNLLRTGVRYGLSPGTRFSIALGFRILRQQTPKHY